MCQGKSCMIKVSCFWGLHDFMKCPMLKLKKDQPYTLRTGTTYTLVATKLIILWWTKKAGPSTYIYYIAMFLFMDLLLSSVLSLLSTFSLLSLSSLSSRSLSPSSFPYVPFPEWPRQGTSGVQDIGSLLLFAQSRKDPTNDFNLEDEHCLHMRCLFLANTCMSCDYIVFVLPSLLS